MREPELDYEAIMAELESVCDSMEHDIFSLPRTVTFKDARSRGGVRGAAERAPGPGRAHFRVPGPKAWPTTSGFTRTG